MNLRLTDVVLVVRLFAALAPSEADCVTQC